MSVYARMVEFLMEMEHARYVAHRDDISPEATHGYCAWFVAINDSQAGNTPSMGLSSLFRDEQ